MKKTRSKKSRDTVPLKRLGHEIELKYVEEMDNSESK
jgi:hypothetical protein